MSIIVNLIAAVTSVLSWITWDNVDMDPLLVGNFYVGLQLPKEIVLISVMFGIMARSARIYISVQVYRKNPHLFQMMELIRAISGNCDQVWPVDPRLDPVAITKTQEAIKKMIAFFHLFLRTLYCPQLTGLVLPIGAFASRSRDNVTSWRLLLTMFWSLHFMLLIDHLYMSAFSSVSLIVIACRYTYFSMKQVTVPRIEGRLSLDAILALVNRSMVISTSIRSLNLILSPVIGFSLTFMFVIITFCTFVTWFDIGAPTLYVYILGVYNPIQILALLLVLHLVARIPLME